MNERGNIEEIFDSVQGEGPCLGYRQVFVRFGGCNLACAYCDTPQARRPVATCRVELMPGSNEHEYVANPLAVSDVMGFIERLMISGRHSVSLTGGEPLLQNEFLAGLLPELKSGGTDVYLETNSTMPDKLKGLVDYFKWVAADVKLPSCTGEPDRFIDNLEFLKLCRTPELFVKLVITESVDIDEFLFAVNMAREAKVDAQVVIQPVTGKRGEVLPGPGFLLDCQMKALEVYDRVRIIPRIHQCMHLS
ncbi:MAG: 7-carboxy-7-deazaguanine synthase QueE [Actinobacteria bacterium]|nr:7-carboxy-7-deazaguanine synthase QueE [Actinomycetota bacterium]